jgi:hypothetical protein
MAECSPHTSERMAVWLTRWLKRPTRSPAALYCLSVCRCSAQLAVDLTELPPLWSLTPHSREGDSAPAYLKCHRGCIMRPPRTHRKKPPKLSIAVRLRYKAQLTTVSLQCRAELRADRLDAPDVHGISDGESNAISGLCHSSS